MASKDIRIDFNSRGDPEIAVWARRAVNILSSARFDAAEKDSRAARAASRSQGKVANRNAPPRAVRDAVIRPRQTSTKLTRALRPIPTKEPTEESTEISALTTWS